MPQAKKVGGGGAATTPQPQQKKNNKKDIVEQKEDKKAVERKEEKKKPVERKEDKKTNGAAPPAAAASIDSSKKKGKQTKPVVATKENTNDAVVVDDQKTNGSAVESTKKNTNNNKKKNNKRKLAVVEEAKKKKIEEDEEMKPVDDVVEDNVAVDDQQELNASKKKKKTNKKQKTQQEAPAAAAQPKQQQQQKENKKKSNAKKSNFDTDITPTETKSSAAEVVTKSITATTKSTKSPVFRNKQRVLVFCSRGVTARHRHLLDDLRKLLPHSKKDAKMDNKDDLSTVNEICETKSCNNCIYLESRKHTDLYMWISRTPNGPSAKFLVQNVATMDELRMTGNSLIGSRPFLSFDSHFDDVPHLRLLKELFIQVFGTPKGHPKSKPFYDHIFSFSYTDKRIFFRNYQIIDPENSQQETSLAEVGPRFVLNPIRIFAGSFTGETLYQNGSYVSPNTVRSLITKGKAAKRATRVAEKTMSVIRHKSLPMQAPEDFAEVFEDKSEITEEE